MKRRTIPKNSINDARGSILRSSSRGGTASKSIRSAVKKTAKNRPSRSAASSILGLKKTEFSSKGSTRWSSNDTNLLSECQRLREQLEGVLVDHQRQEEEIVALRALAKSLKEEVEMMQGRQHLRSSSCSSDNTIHQEAGRCGSHEFFKLDVQVEELQEENTELRHQLENFQEELMAARTYIAQKLPVYKLAAVKATAELRCVKSQLHQERAHSDLLQKQLVKCKAKQDDVPVRVLPDRSDNQEAHDEDLQESEIVRREREAFLRQCMRLQDNRTLPADKPNLKTTKPSKAVDSVYARETRKQQLEDFTSSIEPDTTTKTNKLAHEDFHGLDFFFDELNLSKESSTNSSKSRKSA